MSARNTALILLPVAFAGGVIGVFLYEFVVRDSGYFLRAIALAAFWPVLLAMWVVGKAMGRGDGVSLLLGSVAQFLYLWGLVRLAAGFLRAHPLVVRSTGMRWFLTVLAYLGLLCVVGIVALVFALLLAESHGGLLPHSLRPFVFILAWIAVLVLPVLGARAAWRRLGVQ